MHQLISFLVCKLGILLLGFTAVLSRLIEWPVLVTVFSRSVLAVLSLALYIIFKRQSVFIPRRYFVRILVTGGCLAVHWVTYFKAVELAGVAIGLLALFTFPVMTVLVEPIWYRTRYSVHNIIAASLCFIGLFSLFQASIHSDQIIYGIGVGLLSAGAYTVRNLISKPLLHHISSSHLMLNQSLVAALCYAVYVLVTDVSVLHVSFSIHNILYALLLGTVFTGVAHTLFISGFKYFSASFVSILAAAQPLYGTILGIYILNEIPTVSTWLGGSLILIAIIYATVKASIRD